MTASTLCSMNIMYLTSYSGERQKHLESFISVTFIMWTYIATLAYIARCYKYCKASVIKLHT